MNPITDAIILIAAAVAVLALFTAWLWLCESASAVVCRWIEAARAWVAR